MFRTRIKHIIDWLFGRWYEGPSCPRRLQDVVTVWANEHPHATRGEWQAVCERAVRNAYEAGWQRGYEHVERTWAGPQIEPQVLADAQGEEWRWRGMADVQLNGAEEEALETVFLPAAPDVSPQELYVLTRRRDGLPL